MDKYHTIIRMYRYFLRLFSPYFRQEFEEEMMAVFQAQLEKEAANGRLALLLFLLRELAGVVAASLYQRLYSWRTRSSLIAQTSQGVDIVVTVSMTDLPFRHILLLIVMLVMFAISGVVAVRNISAASDARHQRVSWIRLLDLDGDTDLDAYWSSSRSGGFLMNEGDGRFTDAGRSTYEDNLNLLLRLNGEAIFIDAGDGKNAMPDVSWWYTDSERTYGIAQSYTRHPFLRSYFQTAHAIVLTDLNGDGALDVFLGQASRRIDGELQRNLPNKIWLNNGQDTFYNSGQRLGEYETYSVALGDVNGDGFPDAVVGNDGPDEVWLNDGLGNFRHSGQRLDRSLTLFVFLADLDGDGDLDLVTGSQSRGQVWLNDGTGQFQRGQRFGYGRDEAFTVGDVTGDGIDDIFVAGVESYQVWHGVGDGRFTPAPRTGMGNNRATNAHLINPR